MAGPLGQMLRRTPWRILGFVRHQPLVSSVTSRWVSPVTSRWTIPSRLLPCDAYGDTETTSWQS